jgi:hypothetical protein
MSFRFVRNICGDEGGNVDSILGTMVGLGMVNPLALTMGNMMQNIAPNVAQQQTAQKSKNEVIKLLKDLGNFKAAGIF